MRLRYIFITSLSFNIMLNSLKIKEVYNKRAKAYDKIFEKIRYNSTLRAIINSTDLDIPKDSNILDIGCGTGLATEILLEKYPESKIMGLDYSEEMLKIYNEKFKDITSLLADFNNTTGLHILKKDSFNLVISTGAVSEYGDLDIVIPFIYKIIKNNGLFVNIGIKKNFMNFIPSKLWHYKPAGRKKFSLACKNSGFKEINSIKLSWNHFPTNIMKFAIIARK